MSLALSWSLNFFFKSKLYKNSKANIGKKESKLRAFWGWEVQKQEIIMTKIFISFKNLLTKEWPEKHQSHLLWCNMLPVLYPKLFWSQYIVLGAQTHTPKRSKVLISGVSFRQRSLSQSQESDVLSYSERKIAKNFQGFAPGPHWEGLTAPAQTPRLHNGFSPRYIRRKTGTPKRYCFILYSNFRY